LVVDSESLLKVGRSRLKFTGKVTTQIVTKSEALSPEFGSVLAMTSSNDDTSQHLIKYVEALDDSGMFHELCHLKLNEIGFKKVETEVEHMLPDLKSDKERDEMKKAVILVAEVYANFLLFKYFKQESKPDMENLDKKFLTSKAIVIVVRKFEYMGIASAAGHRISKKWNGYDNDDDFKWAFARAPTPCTNINKKRRISPVLE